MKILASLGKILGIYPIQENYVAPVMRLGMFHRLAKPPMTWVIPIFERLGNLIYIGFRVADFVFEQVLTNDSIPLKFRTTVLYCFDPEQVSHRVLAQLVRASPQILEDIVRSYANTCLRQVATRFSAEEICGGQAIGRVLSILESLLNDKLKPLGLSVLPDSGILLEDIYAPEDFVRTMLLAKRHEVTLRVLQSYQASKVDQALLAELVNGLVDREGPLQFLSLADLLSFPELVRGHGRRMDETRVEDAYQWTPDGVRSTQSGSRAR